MKNEVHQFRADNLPESPEAYLAYHRLNDTSKTLIQSHSVKNLPDLFLVAWHRGQ